MNTYRLKYDGVEYKVEWDKELIRVTRYTSYRKWFGLGPKVFNVQVYLGRMLCSIPCYRSWTDDTGAPLSLEGCLHINDVTRSAIEATATASKWKAYDDSLDSRSPQ